jgi:hypothetical protein
MSTFHSLYFLLFFVLFLNRLKADCSYILKNSSLISKGSPGSRWPIGLMSISSSSSRSGSLKTDSFNLSTEPSRCSSDSWNICCSICCWFFYTICLILASRLASLASLASCSWMCFGLCLTYWSTRLRRLFSSGMRSESVDLISILPV